MAPIIKNSMMRVVDIQGNEQGVTYYKRAKGLVKNGRARYIDDSCIQMLKACPPNKSEDETMIEYIDEIRDNDGNVIIGEKRDSTADEAVWKEAEYQGGTVTVADIIKRIDYIIGDSEYLTNAIEEIGRIEAKDVAYGSHNASDKAKAIRDTARGREETNQKIVDFLSKIYNDIRPVQPNPVEHFDKQEILKVLNQGMVHCAENTRRDIMQQMLSKVF